MDKSNNNELTETGILNLMDERFKRKYVLYDHLHSSYNSLIEKIVNYMETNDNIFDENRVGDLIYRHRFKIENTIIRPPTSDKNDRLKFPQDARDNNDTYGIQFISKITQIMEVYDLNLKTITKVVEVGKVEKHQTGENFPVMVRSKYCSLEQGKEYRDKDCEMDPGGYFIVNGAEKIVLSFEKMIENKPLVFTKKTPDSLIYKVKINSKSSNPNIMMQGIEITLEKNGDMIIKAPIFNEVSVFVLLRALGLETDKEIVSYIMYGNEDIEMLNVLKKAIELSKQSNIKQILNKEDAYTILTNKIRVIKKYSDKDRKLQYEEKKEHLNALLRNAFMPHIDSDKYADPLKAKGYFLGYMINKLIKCYLGKIQPDDRDSFTNKRIDLPGDLIFDLYKQYYKKLINDCNKFFKKRNPGHDNPLNIIGQFKSSNIEQAIKSAMMTGNWGKKKGVAQMYPRLTFLQSLSFLRRVDAPSADSSTMKLTGPRHYHPSQVGFLCPIESPEHANIGLVKHMSLSASITTGTVEQSMIVYNILKENKNFIHLDNISILSISKQTKIFINGEWLGQCDNALELYKELKTLKQNGIILRTTGITYDIPNREIKIYTDSGRLYRPLLKVENNELILKDSMIQSIINDKNYNGMNKWDALLEKYPQAIEYIDMEESYFSLIAQNIESVIDMKERSKQVIKDNDKPIINRYDSSLIMNFTHCEIHPTMIIGIIAGNIPFSNHNQGPRNIFQYAQGRQAMGFHNTHYRDRLDISYILYNTQKPLISTKIAKYTHTDVLPCGENAVVMIGCYSGYNQDDSIIFNQSSIERGLFRSSSYKKWGSKIEKNQSTSQDDKFMKPDPSKLTGTRHVNYDKLNDKGYVPEETEVNNGDVIIGKVSPIQPVAGSNKCYKDSSEIYKSLEPAIIDKVFDGLQDNEGYDIIKIRTRSERIPKVGDKFCLKIDPENPFEVLTGRGWLTLENITMDDEIATLVNGNELVYSKPIGIYTLNYNGKMYKVRSQQVDLDVTMDHNMYVNIENNGYILTEAKNIKGKNYKFKMNCEINNINNNIDKLDFDINNITRLPDYILNLNLKDSRKIFDEININVSYNKELCDDIMKLGIHSGYVTSLEYDIDNKYYIRKCENNEQEINSENEQEYEYNGKVGCLEVPSHVFMIRQNNKNVWIGNCCYVEDTEVLTDNGWILIKDLTMNHKVASLMEDDSLEYHNPIALQQFDHTDELYKINSNHVDLIVTKNHHMYVGTKEGKNFKRKMASEIYNKLITYKKNVDVFEPENPIGNIFTIKGIKKEKNDKDKKENKKEENKDKPKILYLDILIDYSENYSSEDKTINKKLNFINTKLVNYKKTNTLDISDSKTINKYIKEIFNLECDVSKMKFRPIIKRESNIITELEYPEFYDRKISNTYDKSMDEYKTENNKQKCSEDINIDMNSWLIFFGIWMAEGHAVSSGEYVSIATHKPRVKYALNVALKNIDINCCKYKEHTKDIQYNCWRIFDKRIYNFFKDLSVGAVNKKLPDWVWNLTREQCRVLIFGMWLGDGSEDISVNKDSGTSTSLKKYVTSSSRLADDFQRLCLHAGFCTNKRIKCEEGNVGLGKNKIVVASTTSYILSIITSQVTPSVNKNVKSIEDQSMFNDLEDTRPKIVDKYKIDNLTKEELDKIEENKKIKNYSDKYISWSDYYKGLELKKYRTSQIIKDNNKIYEESCKLFDDNSDSENKISKDYTLNNDKIKSKQTKIDNENSKNEKLSKGELEKQKYEIKRANVNNLIQEETNYINNLNVSNTGKVYCCTVPGKGVIYVRRNGLAVWCGQSRHGQKGTIGLTLHRADMPFTKDGITPDLIVNPQAIPSRMTIGQLVECLLGKVATLKGVEADGTPFKRLDLEKLKDELEKLGYDRNCNEFMYNGMTGEKLRVPIFIGPTFYQRLKHLTADKMHSRARGPTTMLTHQPPEGRSKEGGLRNGEMERDVLISYGMSKFLKERLLDASDIHSCYVCGECGLFAKRVIQKTSSSTPKNNDTYECIGCRNNTNIKKVIIPYAFKLLIQELMSMNIAPRIKYKNINNDTDYLNSMKPI